MNKNLIERLDNGKGVIAVIVEDGKVITRQSLYTPLEDETWEEYRDDNQRQFGELINSFFAMRNLGEKTSSNQP